MNEFVTTVLLMVVKDVGSSNLIEIGSQVCFGKVPVIDSLWLVQVCLENCQRRIFFVAHEDQLSDFITA